MKCKKRLIELVESMGGTVDEYDRELYLDSPRGKCWNASSCHVLVVDGDNGSQTWWAQACQEAMDEVKLGLCDDEDDDRYDD